MRIIHAQGDNKVTITQREKEKKQRKGKEKIACLNCVFESLS